METRSPYKSARDLGIEPWEHEGLVALVGPLCRGELRLDMRTPLSEVQSCGTVACIGGHIALRRGLSSLAVARYVKSYRRVGGRAKHRLTPLFFPELPNAWFCTAEQAGAAIVNFLTLGEPRWDDVMCGR